MSSALSKYNLYGSEKEEYGDVIFNRVISKRIDSALNNHVVYETNTAEIGSLPKKQREVTVSFYRNLTRIPQDAKPTEHPYALKGAAYVAILRADQALSKLVKDEYESTEAGPQSRTEERE